MIKKFSKGEAESKAFKHYAKMLTQLQPRAKIQLSGPSLVVKYSLNNPNLLLTADSTGSIFLVDSLKAFDYKLEKYPNVALMEARNITKAHDYPIFDLDWHDDSTKYITGGADPACMVWDTETGNCLWKSFSHTRTVRCVKSYVIASGGRDGQLFTYDLRCTQGSGSNSNYVSVIDGNLVDSGKEELEAFTGICFYSDEKTLLTTQSGNNGVKLWDTRLIQSKMKKKTTKNSAPNPANVMIIDKTLPLQYKINEMIDEINNFKENSAKTKEQLRTLWEMKSKLDGIDVNSTLKEDNIKGLTSIHISRSEDKILVNQIDHTLALYDLNKMHKEEPLVYKGLRSSLYVRSTLSPCSRFIASGSADQGLHIWQADKPGDSLVKLYGGHTGEINCVDWSTINYNAIATVGDDSCLVLWEYDFSE